MRLRRTLLAALALAATAACAVAAPGQAATRARVVRLPFPKYDGTLTPYTFEVGYPLVTLVYDTLLWRDAQGVPRPWLAQSVKSSNGGRRLTIRLRPGARWHDGRPVTAADVAFTFAFVARRFHPRFTPQLSDVSSVVATERRTVTIDLRRPSLGFYDQPLADLPILPRHLWQGLAPGAVPPGPAIGSGPYRITRAGRRTGYSFRANKGYFKGRPRVDRIRVPIIREEARTYSALQERKVDMLPVSLPETATEQLSDTFGITIRKGPSYSGTALLFNLRRAPFNRRSARAAVASSLELARIVKNVGAAIPAGRGYIHPGSPWAAPARLQRLDLPAARRAFGKLHLPPIRVLAPDNDPVRLEAGRQVTLALSRGGAEARLTTLSRAKLGRAIGENGSGASFEAAIVSTPPLASYDPDFLRRLFGSDARDAPLNYGGYRSQAFEALADRVASTPQRSARRRAVAAELSLLARDLPALPLFFSEGRFAYRPAIHDGWVFVKGTGILDKQSFLRGGSSSPARSRGGGEGTDESSNFVDILRLISLGLLVLVLLLGGAALLQRRKAGGS